MSDVWDSILDDPDHPNHDQLQQLAKLYRELPEGWTHNPDLSTHGKAPYVHADGTESFTHPNRNAIDAIAKEMQQQQQRPPDSTSSVDRARIKKLRMMLQAGLSVEAVEQRAILEGIDMSLVLGEVKVDSAEEAVTAPSDSGAIPAPLLKKYKRMIKSGVPLKGVQAQAFVDGRYSPEQVVTALDDVLDTTKDVHKEQYAVSQSKQPHRQPSDPKDLWESLESLATEAAKPKPVFSVEGSILSFSADANLKALICKMVQTVDKRARTSKDAKMEVNAPTLYNALGALQGVQVARDRYNSTCDATSRTLSIQEVKAKRQAFVEIANSMSMKLPSSISTRVEIDGLDELVSYIEKTFAKEIEGIQNLLADGWYDFDSLALLYPPGGRVVAKNAGGGGVDMMCQVAWNRYEQGRTIMGQPMKYFKVCFQYVVAVGASQATLAEVVEGMEFFEGRRAIRSSLTFVPLTAYTASEQETMQSRYRRRGEVYNQVALAGKHAYMTNEKGCFFLKRGGSLYENISGGGSSSATTLATGGRIIVDTQGAYDSGHTLSVGYDPMVTGIKYKFKEYSLHLRSAKQEESSSKTAPDDGQGLVLLEKVPDDFLDLVWPAVVGFSLTAKAWGDVLIDGLGDIQWQEDVFDRVVLPEKHKTMVKALVRHSSDSFQDLVEGKGAGTVFLVHGPPGTGKTLTAEAVAELLHKPLYSLSMGTLGTTPGELEQRLGQIMTMAAKWDAIILLDEADSFLEARSSNASLERNAMVSVMLKLVEYFSGILFLTSNRIDCLDPAFQTRITLALRYEPLDVKAHCQVWKNLLLKSGFDVDDGGNIDPRRLAKAAALNGREIKNALRLAMAMAAEKGEDLTQAILLDTIAVVNDYKIGTTNLYESDEKSEEGQRGCWFRW